MNKENVGKLWKIIQETGDYLGEQKDNLTYTRLYYSAVVMQILKSQLKKNRLKTHQFNKKLDNKLEMKEVYQALL